VIFVTVGNATQPFPRLTTAVDQLVAEGAFGAEPVFVQTGSDTAFRSKRCEHRPFLSESEFQSLIQECRLVICHAGCGTLRNVLLARKRPVVMPRRKRYGEHVSDHQMQLARALSAQERIFPAYEADGLAGAIADASVAPELPPLSPPPIVGMVAMAVDALGSAAR
jgi:UDP-N-acetylglucosamine transferase subunit ALG13